MNVTIDIKQLKDLSKKLEKAGPKTVKMAQLELRASAFTVEGIAKSLSPVDRGGLEQSIASEAITKNDYKIGSNKDYAAYVEFGTGVLVDVPGEWSQFAAQFQGSTGEGWDNGLEEIRQWCIRKGIPEGAAYPIFMSILESGIMPQPFLYPAYKLGRKQLIYSIKQIIKDFNLE